MYNNNKVYMNFMLLSTKEKEINLYSFDTSLVKNMGFMFYDADVTELNLSNFNTASV